MASQSESEVSVSALIDRLMAMPFLSGFTTARPESDHESTDPPPSLDRIILINPVTQGMVVIGGSSTGFNSLMNNLMMRKDGQPPASQASIDGLPSLEVKGTDDIQSLEGECVICLEEWGVGDVAKEMPCKHKFHGACVEKWLRVHGSCPVCRHKMPVDDSSHKKLEDDAGRIRREIWVTVQFGNWRPTNEESNEDSSV